MPPRVYPRHLKVILPEHIRPTYVDGRWRKPFVSARLLAKFRKQAAIDGEAWTLENDNNNNNRRREKTIKFKGHKWERTEEERKARIAQAMKEMPKRVEEYYRLARARRVPKTLEAQVFGVDPATAAAKTKGQKATAPAEKRN